MAAARLRTLTAAALRAMPLPSPGGDKEQRGRVLVVGARCACPVRHCWPGKLHCARAPANCRSPPLPAWRRQWPGGARALVLGLGQNGQGEITRGHRALDAALAACDAAVIGPGMASTTTATALVKLAAAKAVCPLVLDAGALSRSLRAPPGRPFVLTPHAGRWRPSLATTRLQWKQRRASTRWPSRRRCAAW